MLPTTKQCTKCKITKNLSEFYKNKSACIVCWKAVSNKYYMKNREKIIEKVKKYREENIDKIRDSDKERSREYRKKYPEKRREASKRYKEKNREKIEEYNKAYSKKHYAENKEKSRIRSLKYREENKEKIAETRRRYRQSEQGKLTELSYWHARREMKIKVSDGSIPVDTTGLRSNELKKLLELQNNKCNDCGKDLSEGKHLDHHVPLSKCGTHSIDNVVWLCPRCNLTKQDKAPDKLLLI